MGTEFPRALRPGHRDGSPVGGCLIGPSCTSMVGDLRSRLAKSFMDKPPIVVELVGLAGVGKSTLSRALSQRDNRLRARLGVWHLPAPLLVGSTFQTVPT